MLNKSLLVTGMLLVVFALSLTGCSSLMPATAPVVMEPTATVEPIAAATSTTAPQAISTETSQPGSQLELVWDIKGDPNPFRTPTGIAVDTENERVQKFDSEGKFVAMWGEPGSGEGQFRNASSWGTLGRLTTDTQGNIYVIDTNNYRVQKFDSSGTYQTQWGAHGPEEGNFQYPYDIAVDAQSNIYICEAQNINRVQKFAATGAFLLAWGQTGYTDGEFAGDQCTLEVDPDGNVLVADRSGRIQKFDPNGQFLSKIALGQVDNILVSPWNIAVGRQGNIYVGDYDNLRIVMLDSEGRSLATWNGKDTDCVPFSSLLDIAVDETGNIYISDALEHTIKKIRES
jgi:tripartite motif-containing protein 71